MSINIRPGNGRVLLEVVHNTQDSSGLYIPSSDNKEIEKAEVVAIGKIKDEEIFFKKGEIVYFSKFAGSVVYENSTQKYVIIKIEEILGVENVG